MSFEAQYSGKCSNCGEPFPAGSTIRYDTSGPAPAIVGECCEDAEIVPDRRSGTTPRTRTMPRGKTAADRCGVCFQVPASNGACGCDR